MTDSADKHEISSGIKVKALELGFDLCGIARARGLDEYITPFMKWLNSGMHDHMRFMERNIDKRFNPGLFFPNAKSMVVTGLSYNSGLKQKDPGAPVISRYSYGRDYHEVILEKLDRLYADLSIRIPGLEGKAVVDSSAVAEKAWAIEAGLGWQGRNSVIVNREKGSFFFIGILILNVELEYDMPFGRDLCGECRICLDECPTGAINNNRTIDARRCIANLTVERKGPIPDEFVPIPGKRIFGCDRCQEVCPWNKRDTEKCTPEFSIDDEIAGLTADEWKKLSGDRFKKLFSKTAIKRITHEKMMSNIDAALR